LPRSNWSAKEVDRSAPSICASGVVPEALRSAVEMARAGTALEGARLIIEDVPVMVYCEACREKRPIASVQRFQCAVCGAPSGRVVAGNELEVRAMEIAS
jgi:hydrogenase nickel incorporation protein HypA/HybF